MLTPGEMGLIVRDIDYKDWDISIAGSVHRPFLQVYFDTEDTAKPGEIIRASGRKWWLSPHMTKSELVQTALMAVLAAEEHEAREHFKYKGRSVFDPHYDVDKLHALRSEADCLDERD